MPFAEILLIALGLAMDAFAVSLAAATSGLATRVPVAMNMSVHFGFFQFLMPLIGWRLGIELVDYIDTFDHWVAFGLLLVVALRMFQAGIHPDENRAVDPAHWPTLLALSVATSIDALAVGLSLALLDVPIWRPSIIIGVVTTILSLVGVQLGKRLGA
ncbi:MAG: manganese efflux pump, partial [Deltaproteobacteria bacterium]|nr:manganese efflux pump [Deltaproteobacteria bacterium]